MARKQEGTPRQTRQGNVRGKEKVTKRAASARRTRIPTIAEESQTKISEVTSHPAQRSQAMTTLATGAEM